MSYRSYFLTPEGTVEKGLSEIAIQDVLDAATATSGSTSMA